MSTNTDLLEILDARTGDVRKWPVTLCAIRDAGSTIPADYKTNGFLDKANGCLRELLPGSKDMGFITVDGVKISSSVETAETKMAQSTKPVREDVTGETTTVDITFGESNAWTAALRQGIPVSQWPEDKDAPFHYRDTDGDPQHHYEITFLYQDGKGDNAHYAYDFFTEVSVSGKGDLTRNPNDPDTKNFTFTSLDSDTQGFAHDSGEIAASCATKTPQAAKTAASAK